MVFCFYIYLFIFIYVILLSSMSVNTLLGDLYQYHFSSSWCIFKAYLITVILTTLYCVCINQVIQAMVYRSIIMITNFCFCLLFKAFFRLCRIVYSTYEKLQFFWLYVLIPPIELIFSFLLLYPILFWNDIVYLPNEHYCYVSFRNYRGMLWIMFNAYGIPLLLLTFIYIRITIFIRRQSTNQTLKMQQRQRRDLLIIRRILINTCLLLILGIPSVILLLILIITGEEHIFIFRISLISASVSMAGLSISTILFTPKLKSVVFTKFQQDSI